jgi:hypothetical protein
MKKRFGIIAVTYGDYFKESFLHSILEQTYKDFDLIIYHDGKDINGWENKLNKYLQATGSSVDNLYWINSSERQNQFGHDLRDRGIREYADNYEWLIITNCDNYYMPIFLEYLNEAIVVSPERTTHNGDYFPSLGVVYWDYIHSHNRGDSSSGGTYGYMKNEFKPCICDIGAFTVRSDIAKRIGFNRRDHNADAGFIQDILDLQKEENNFMFMGLPKVLFVHN